MVTASSVGSALPDLLCHANPSPELKALIGDLPAMDQGAFESWRRDVEMGRLICDMIAKQMRRTPDDDPTQPASPQSIAELAFLKFEYDHAPANIDAYGAIIKDLGQQCRAATEAGEKYRIAAFIDTYERSRRRLEKLIVQFGDLVAGFEAKVRNAFALNGHLLVRQADGGYEWGCFSISEPRTGRVVCRHHLGGTDGTAPVAERTRHANIATPPG